MLTTPGMLTCQFHLLSSPGSPDKINKDTAFRFDGIFIAGVEEEGFVVVVVIVDVDVEFIVVVISVFVEYAIFDVFLVFLVIVNLLNLHNRLVCLLMNGIRLRQYILSCAKTSQSVLNLQKQKRYH